MELATLIVVCFVAMLVVLIIAIPVLIISRTARAVKKSIAKLFHKSPTKA